MMRKVLFMLIITLIIILALMLIKKRYVEFHLVKKIDIYSDYYPFAYKVFCSADEINRFYGYNVNIKLVQKEISGVTLDFKKFNYVIVYGAEINNVYHSPFLSLFSDQSPDYYKRESKRKYIQIEYKIRDSISNIYLYTLDKKEIYRGILAD